MQKHRYTHSEDIKYHDSGNVSKLATSSSWNNSVNTTIGGVGMHIGRRAQESLNRMMVATFKVNPSSTIISCYNVSEENELIAFYDELSSLVRSIPKHNVLVIGGDMNAQIGKTETTNSDNTNRPTEMDNIKQISR